MTMIKGTGRPTLKAWNWLKEGPVEIDRALARETLIERLDEGTKRAFGRLLALNDEVNKARGGDKIVIVVTSW